MKFLNYILYGLSLFIVAINSNAEEYVTNSYYFQNIVIHEVQHTVKPVTHKIIVQSISDKKKTLQNNAQEKDKFFRPEQMREKYKLPPPEQILWTITGDQLSLIREHYLEYEVEPCHESRYPYAKCYKSYIFYGPEFLAYDEKSKIIYLSAPLDGGNAGWPIIIYAANIKTKEVKPLVLEGGPVKATLSPSGAFLAFHWNYLAIVNTRTGEEFELKEPKITKAGKFQMVHVYYDDIKWLDDHTLQFTKTEKLGKFSTDPDDYVVTKILDIKSRTTKIVN